jgi:hypothetical protein
MRKIVDRGWLGWPLLLLIGLGLAGLGQLASGAELSRLALPLVGGL